MTALGAARILGPGEGHDFTIGGDHVVRKGETSGAFSVVEYEGAPGMPGPPLHLHRMFDEAWFMLEGEVEFVTAGSHRLTGPGFYRFIPRGVPHTFRVAGERAARWIGIFSPGRFETLLEELGQAMPAAGPPDPVKLAAIFAKYETEVVAPPSAAD